jgi:hypothetical protein
MDSFEPIRAAAERLHQDVAGCAAPKKPMELVSAAIDHLKLELTWLSTGDPALKGAGRSPRPWAFPFSASWLRGYYELDLLPSQFSIKEARSKRSYPSNQPRSPTIVA